MGRKNGNGPSCGYYWIWILFLLLTVTSLSWCYKEKVRGGGGGKYGGGRGGQREDSMSNNKIGEPSCEELRAMWRYHRRQSRAELTNQIPAFEPPFWELPTIEAAATSGLTSSYDTLRNFRSQSRGRSKGPRHGYRDPPYGRINFFGPSSPRQLRPMEQLIKSLPAKLPPASAVDQPTVHFSPPPTQSPPTPSSLQQLQQMYLEHQREGGSVPQISGDFGTVVLSPPTGQDGRIANKPKALMTPFEKIRFGHADFQGILPDQTKRGLFYYPIRTSRLRPSSPEHQHSRPANLLIKPKSTAVTTSTVPTYPSLPQAPLPSIFSFFRHNILPQDPPSSSIMMDTLLPSCPLVQGLRCTLNQQCSCRGNGLYRCFLGQCHFLSLNNAVEDEETSRGTWHTGPIVHQNQLGLWQQEQQLEEEEQGVENEGEGEDEEEVDDQDQLEEEEE